MSEKIFDASKIEDYKQMIEEKINKSDVKYACIEFDYHTLIRYSTILGWGFWVKGDMISNSKDWNKFKKEVIEWENNNDF